jgi:hypothetical protein
MVTVGDFNGDGNNVDVAAGGPGCVSILLGKGAGAFDPLAVNFMTGGPGRGER